MRILILTKRQYMGKDLLDNRFGRFWELSLELARRGHDVRGITLSYRARQAGLFGDPADAPDGSLSWHSMNLLVRGLPAVGTYLRRARQISTDFKPEIVWACSDVFHAILGRKVARQSGAKYVIDLYDNFESYPATRIPGVLPLFKHALNAAAGVTCVSPQLSAYLHDQYRCSAPILVLENAVRTDLFYPRDRDDSRRQLNLPQTARLIGTAGALDKSRGIEALYRGFEILAPQEKDLHLVLAGHGRRDDATPRGNRIHDLGDLPLETVPFFFNALDVAVVCNRDSSFGRFNFPQKAREIIACRVPVVAAAVGSMNELLRSHPDCLYEPEDPASLANTIQRQLRVKTVIDTWVPSWADSAKQLSDFFQEIVDDEPTHAVRNHQLPSGTLTRI